MIALVGEITTTIPPTSRTVFLGFDKYMTKSIFPIDLGFLYIPGVSVSSNNAIKIYYYGGAEADLISQGTIPNIIEPGILPINNRN